LTLASDAVLDSYFVSDVDVDGFTIRIRPSLSDDVMINWTAFGQVSADTIETSSAGDTSSTSDTGAADSLTDLANNYLEDHGLTLDDTTTTTASSTPVEQSSTSTPIAEEPIAESLVGENVTATPPIEEPAPTEDTSTPTSTEGL